MFYFIFNSPTELLKSPSRGINDMRYRQINVCQLYTYTFMKAYFGGYMVSHGYTHFLIHHNIHEFQLKYKNTNSRDTKRVII